MHTNIGNPNLSTTIRQSCSPSTHKYNTWSMKTNTNTRPLIFPLTFTRNYTFPHLPNKSGRKSILCYTPPFTLNVKDLTKVLFEIVETNFPHNHKYHSIFYRSILKLSFSHANPYYHQHTPLYISPISLYISFYLISYTLLFTLPQYFIR